MCKFIPGLAGYIWSFPRRDHFSVGICGKMGGKSTKELRCLLEEFVQEEGFEWEDSRFYSHVLPALGDRSLRHLLAEALIADRPDQYQEQVATDFPPDLQIAARIADRFFFGTILGGGVIERMVEFTESSPSFRKLMCDLFAGSQSYVGLKRRAYRNLLPSVVELFAHHVFGDDHPVPRQPSQGAT